MRRKRQAYVEPLALSRKTGNAICLGKESGRERIDRDGLSGDVRQKSIAEAELAE